MGSVRSFFLSHTHTPVTCPPRPETSLHSTTIVSPSISKNYIEIMRSLLLVSLSSILLVAQAFSPILAPAVSRSSTSTSGSALRASTALSMANGGVVITGSAGGVGFAYAGEFMDRGYDVVICDVKDCTSAARALSQKHPNGKVFHTKCDVSDAKSVEKLAEFSRKNLGTVKYWINNAGVNGGRRDLRDVPISQVELVVKVNLLGTLLCTKAAMQLMGEQVRAPERHKDILPFFVHTDNILPSGWSHWSHFQHCWKWSQRRRYPRICLLWSHKAWIASIDRKFGQRIGCRCSRI